MEQILEVVLQNLPLLYVPALGAVLALVLLRIKKRYVHQGYIFWRSASSLREPYPSLTAESDMPTENKIDLDIALQKFHELGLEGGDLGYAYWYKVGQLLQRAASMQVQIDELRKELELCQAKQRKRH
ncbi:hypothetical protein [Paraburkholderia sp. 40]|uniref:hypothetical protein n=1 Tax=Paraburkholderia sp. 40 TaxID=2991059 RepID=UPI003D1EC8A9